MKQRRRFKQTASLEQRLIEQAARWREQAKVLPPGGELRESLLRKAEQVETAVRISERLAPPLQHK
jgi:hypothetical protein